MRVCMYTERHISIIISPFVYPSLSRKSYRSYMNMNANTQVCFVNSSKMSKQSDHMLMQVASKYACQRDHDT